MLRGLALSALKKGTAQAPPLVSLPITLSVSADGLVFGRREEWAGSSPGAQRFVNKASGKDIHRLQLQNLNVYSSGSTGMSSSDSSDSGQMMDITGRCPSIASLASSDTPGTSRHST